MKISEIAHSRLISQHIAGTKFKAAKELVSWMGAMQAQDYAMVKWALGVRLPNLTEQTIQAAVDKGEIIRTHLLRPTWHLVSADDIYWILELTAPQFKIPFKSRHKELGISSAILTKSNSILAKALRGGKHLTREEMLKEYEKAKIATDENRASHLLGWAESEGIICSGAAKNGKQTYALLEERIPKTSSLPKEESLARLAKRYFTSHCPATLQDFVWWSGLSVGDAKLALELVKADFILETIDSKTYLLPHSFSIPKPEQESTYLLPAFDEFLISYKDRSASLPFANDKQTISSNGIFWPIVVINGQVKGMWKRTIKKDKVIVEAQLFTKPNKFSKSSIEKAAEEFGNYLEKQTEINVIT